MLKGRTPEEAMKDTIYQYYQLFYKKNIQSGTETFVFLYAIVLSICN